METTKTKVTLPGNKQELLDRGNYEIYNHELMRKVFPRIIAEHDAAQGRRQRKPQIRDIIALYFYLLSYVSGVEKWEDGRKNDRFGAAFPAVITIADDLGIAEKRVKHLTEILESNGLLRRKRIMDGMLYYMNYCPMITDDGYIVNEDGEKVVPDVAIYTLKKHVTVIR